MALRAMHASNNTPQFLHQKKIPAGTGESSHVKTFVGEVIQHFEHTTLLEAFSFDAGLSSLELADYVSSSGYSYIMALKGSQQTLHHYAIGKFREQKPCHVKEEYANGRTYKRTLKRHRLGESGCYTWTHLKEMWCVEQTVFHKSSGQVLHEECRYFMTNIAPEKLTDARFYKQFVCTGA